MISHTCAQDYVQSLITPETQSTLLSKVTVPYKQIKKGYEISVLRFNNTDHELIADSSEEHWNRSVIACKTKPLVILIDKTNITLWNTRTSKLIKLCTGHTDTIRSLDCNYDETLLVSCSNDKTVRIWDIEQGLHIRTLHMHTDPITSVAFHPEKNIIVSASKNGRINVSNIAHLYSLNNKFKDIQNISIEEAMMLSKYIDQKGLLTKSEKQKLNAMGFQT